MTIFFNTSRNILAIILHTLQEHTPYLHKRLFVQSESDLPIRNVLKLSKAESYLNQINTICLQFSPYVNRHLSPFSLLQMLHANLGPFNTLSQFLSRLHGRPFMPSPFMVDKQTVDTVINKKYFNAKIE